MAGIHRPVILIVLDGYGVAPPDAGNAVALAETPHLRQYASRFPAMTVLASGEEVGLAWGEMGNSEVGHLTIGAGRVYYQSLPRINRAIASGEFMANPAFLQVVSHLKRTGGKLHLLGCASDGNVHASLEHLMVLLDFAKQQKLDRVFIHAILDGRDTVYNAGVDFVGQIVAKTKAIGLGKIATLSGRFWAMDRDHRWDRVQKAYDAIVLGTAERTASDPVQAVRDSYAKEVYDEEFVPTVILEDSKPVATFDDGDALIYFNFRPDRARELTRALVEPGFDGFERTLRKDTLVVTMCEYQPGLPAVAAFPPEELRTCLAKVISDAKLTQLHVAETEKYAHITYFLNGMREEPFPGEDRDVLPSLHVPSYDQKPEMSAREITERVLRDIKESGHDFIAVNFANADMVGHTGNLEATTKAAEIVDECVGRIVDAALPRGGVVFITADHGNAEEVVNLQTGAIDKEHSTYPVPFIVVGKSFEGMAGETHDAINGDLSLVPPVGTLADVAPTILKVMHLPQPPDMTGRALL